MPLMVYVKEDDNETITDAYAEAKGHLKGITVETENGRVKYWFPKIELDGEFILIINSDDIEMEITSNVDGENMKYTGSDDVIVPKKVVEKAESFSGYRFKQNSS